jgi:predicted nucleotidyltransferase
MLQSINQLPETYQANIHRAVKILKAAGCTDIFLFGSLVHGKIYPETDIDLAVRGCPSGQFFQLWGKLSSELDYAIDLVNLDLQRDFGHFLEEEQELVKIV